MHTVKIKNFPTTDFWTPLIVITPSFFDMNASNYIRGKFVNSL